MRRIETSARRRRAETHAAQCPSVTAPYDYDANANLAGIIDGRDGMESRTLSYGGRNRLASITGTPGSIGNESFTYDTLDNVRRAVGGGVDRRFHYNASTLRLSHITTINSPNVMDYAWNDRGELTSRAHTEPGSPTSPHF